MTNRGIPITENIDVMMRTQTGRPPIRSCAFATNSETNERNLPLLLEEKPLNRCVTNPGFISVRTMISTWNLD